MPPIGDWQSGVLSLAIQYSSLARHLAGEHLSSIENTSSP